MSLSLPSLCALTRALASDASVAGADTLQARGKRRAQGAFFTPPALVSFVTETALDLRFAQGNVAWHPDGYPLLRVLDPAAGDGRFLLEAARSLARRGRALSLQVDERMIHKHCLVGIERDPRYAEIARSQLYGEAIVHENEALLSGTVADSSVDLVLGNPPYLRSIALGRIDAELRRRLRHRYAATSHGEWDLYAAFLEQGMRWMGDGGVLAMVVPSRWWTAKWAGPLRASLAESGALSALVDFGDYQIFSDATVYASVCIAAQKPSKEVEIARLHGGKWQLGAVQHGELGTAPWDLAIGSAREFVTQVRSRGTPLGEMARIAKGTGTNADSVFLIESGDTEIESTLLHRVLRGRDVQALGRVPSWPRLLVPYKPDGTLIAPEEMRARFPQALAHLELHRDTLEARERGRFAGDRFYCFGRPQNLGLLQEKRAKVVVPDVTREGRALLDVHGALVLDSAYAIRLSADAPIDHETLCGVLNSRLVGLWLRSQGLPLRGGYTRMKTAYLTGLPMPPSSAATRRIAELVLAKPSQSALDEQVRLAFEVPKALWYAKVSSG